LNESHELDACLLDEGPRPKGGKSRPNLHGGWKINWFKPYFLKRRSKGELMI